jgi:hypothetical protein
MWDANKEDLEMWGAKNTRRKDVGLHGTGNPTTSN